MTSTSTTSTPIVGYTPLTPAAPTLPYTKNGVAQADTLVSFTSASQ